MKNIVHPSAPAASTADPCPALCKSSRTPRHWKLPNTITQPNHPAIATKAIGNDNKKHNLRIWIFYCSKSALNVRKDLPEIKTSHLSTMTFMITNYLPCQCKIPIQNLFLAYNVEYLFVNRFLAHLSRRLTRWAYRMGLEPASVHPSVHTFKHEYLRDQQADYNQILSEASLGWGKGCIMLWCRSDQNSGFYGNG